MPKTVTIKLREPLVGHGGQVTELIVKEPKGRDFLELGEPHSYARAGKDGLVVHTENDAAVQGYFERCVGTAKGPKDLPLADPILILDQLCLADAIAVKEAILSFFMDARLAFSAAPSNSSSSSAGATSTGSAS